VSCKRLIVPVMLEIVSRFLSPGLNELLLSLYAVV
jgi:hypothetical protein